MPAMQPYLPRPGMSEQAIVEEMIHNLDSEYWKQFYDFIKLQVSIRANNFSWSSREEITQEAMQKVFRYLPHFRFDSSLRTWLYMLISSCIADESRRLAYEERIHISLGEPSGEDDHESEQLKGIEVHSISPEEALEQIEDVRELVDALLEYARIHHNPVRNRQIILMWIAGYIQEEIASTIGCHPGVVSYVVRAARDYVLQKMQQP
jgi:RNA polymerase sigma factor (sigma-70 family)